MRRQALDTYILLYNLLLTCSRPRIFNFLFFFFFNDTATTEIYTLSLHDALPISWMCGGGCRGCGRWSEYDDLDCRRRTRGVRSEEHTSELQSLTNLVCRLLLEKKKINNT